MEIRAKSEQDSRLLLAAAEGDIEGLKDASSHSLRNTVCTSGCTCLHWAAGCNQVEVLSYLVMEREIPVDLRAVKKARDRTPLHYACRNGHLEAAKWLVEIGGADPDARAKHGVSPFQLAVWQNRLTICQWLVEDCGVDPAQLNDFECGAVHWIGLSPYKQDTDLLPLAKWLDAQPGVDFRPKQSQGHSALHKAVWGGHLTLIKYLHEHQDLWDDSQDDAGNFAADIADMANTTRHAEIATYLRHHCSRARAESCAILGVPTTATESDIRKAYFKRARELHPDRQLNSSHQLPTSPKLDNEFDALHKAYRHLVDHGGRGNQSNPAHSLNLMLENVSATESHSKKTSTENDDSLLFKARLIVVLLEYGDRGLDLSNVKVNGGNGCNNASQYCFQQLSPVLALNFSNVKKKWKQVWPNEPFPDHSGDPVSSSSNKRKALSDFLVTEAGDVIKFVKDDSGTIRVFAKHHTQESVARKARLASTLQGS